MLARSYAGEMPNQITHLDIRGGKGVTEAYQQEMITVGNFIENGAIAPLPWNFLSLPRYQPHCLSMKIIVLDRKTIVLDESQISQRSLKTQASKRKVYLLYSTHSPCILEKEVRKVGNGPDSLLSFTDLMHWDSHKKRQKVGGKVHMYRCASVCECVCLCVCVCVCVKEREREGE